jgi:benzodiazapine receptor
LALSWLGALFGLVALALALPILAHAFRRSVGTGVMTLCVPAYVLVYAFTQFEHPRKGPVVFGWIGALVLCAVFLALGSPVA